MTNKERAEKLFNSLTHRQQSISYIERALDEAEKRGADRAYKFDQSVGAQVAFAAYKTGQKEMRERAKNIMKGYSVVFGEQINAIPIEGE